MSNSIYLINTSNEYILDVKMLNFKNILSQLISSINNLEDEDDITVLLQNCQELIKQFNYIYGIYTDFQNEDKINKLQLTLNTKDSQLKELDNKLKYEKSVYEKKLSESNIKNEKREKTIKELELILHKQGEELTFYKNKDEEKNLSASYINTLNDANNKLLQQKIEKINQLEEEYNEIFDTSIELQEQNNNFLNDIQVLKREIEQLTNKNLDLKNENTGLKNENNEIKMYNDDLLKQPLLNNIYENPNKETDTCNFCCIM